MRRLLFSFFLSTTCLAMEETPTLASITALTNIAPLPVIIIDTRIDDTRVVDTDKLNLDMHYNMALKCLNLSDITMGDEGFSMVWDQIKLFVLTNKVESLVLENIGLSHIPYFVVSFALTNETLQYVSLMHNNFGIKSNSPNYDQQISYLVEDASMHSDDSRAPTPEVSSDAIPPSAPRKLTRSSTGADIAVSVVEGLWGSIATDVQKVITEHNTASNAMKFYKKIILLDKHIPPITVINQTTLPVAMTTKKKVFYILERITFVGLGAFITLIPTLLPYLLSKYDTKQGSD